MVALSPDSDTQSNAARLESKIAQESFKRLDIHPFYLQSVDSTQNYASTVLKGEREGDLVISEIQTLGKGREGRSWVSQAGGLWMTIVLLPPSPKVLEKLVYVGANAVIKALGEHGAKSSIKPPNDVYCNGRKIAGILADTVIQGDSTVVYLGIGVNVNNDVSKDSSISEMAINLSKLVAREVDLIEFAVALLRNLDQLYFDEVEDHISHN